jgi:hypothetical protein
VLCVAGCFTKPEFVGSQSSDGGVDALGPRVFSSPGPAPSHYLNSYASPIEVTLAADDPTTTIHYTTDGTFPTEASPSGPSPIADIPIAGSLTLRYFGVGPGGAGVVTSDVFGIRAANQTDAGYLVTDVQLDGGAPVVETTPGGMVSGLATVSVWVQDTCAVCSAQLVYGVDAVDQGCLYAGDPGLFPGVMTNAGFLVTAPSTPGTYEIQVAHIEETSCELAMAAMALVTRPTVARIGILIVR